MTLQALRGIVIEIRWGLAPLNATVALDLTSLPGWLMSNHCNANSILFTSFENVWTCLNHLLICSPLEMFEFYAAQGLVRSFDGQLCPIERRALVAISPSKAKPNRAPANMSEKS